MRLAHITSKDENGMSVGLLGGELLAAFGQENPGLRSFFWIMGRREENK